jgi:hypothetical protein
MKHRKKNNNLNSVQKFAERILLVEMLCTYGFNHVNNSSAFFLSTTK